MRILHRVKAPALGLVTVLALSGCGILDVNNPNNLVEENIRLEAAASGVVNGAQALVSNAVANMWQPYMVASDEMYWIGSRDAWLALDQGYVSNPENEFTDGAFPSLGEARWMAAEAVEILDGHVGTNPTDGLKYELARANLYAGIIYMIIGEIQEDFAFSNKKESGAPIGPANMATVLDQAVSYLSAAVSGFAGIGEDEMETVALAVRARARFSRAAWTKMNSPTPATPLVSSAEAGADAAAVLGRVGDDWRYDFEYSSTTVTNGMANWVNDRKENQFDLTLVNVDAANDIVDVALVDPVTNAADEVVEARLQHWKKGAINTKGDNYAPLSIVSADMMHLILAENALVGGDVPGFTGHINDVRGAYGITDYDDTDPAQPTPVAMLEHQRRAALLIMGQRLGDMYRFGSGDVNWIAGSDAEASPGTFLPITIIEIRANCNLNGLGCGG